MTGNRSRGRRTNLVLLVLAPAAVLTGLFTNAIGSDWVVAPAMVHGLVGLAMLATTPWKSVVVRRGVQRRRPSRWMSYGLLAATASTVVSGLVHTAELTTTVGALTIMQIHVGGGLITLLLLVGHFRSHPVTPRAADFDRRDFVRSVGLAGLATVLWAAWETGAAANRRFTGSHQRSSFHPAQMPVTQWFDDSVQRIDGSDWRLEIDGVAYGLDEISAIPRESVTATLDCTGGWYSEQRWEGVRLDRLLDPETASSIEIRSITGYARRFPIRDLDRIWLATHVGGEPLSSGHGFPIRVVAPDRRGFWWVKWVVEINRSSVPWWVQSPFPLT